MLLSAMTQIEEELQYVTVIMLKLMHEEYLCRRVESLRLLMQACKEVKRVHEIMCKLCSEIK